MLSAGCKIISRCISIRSSNAFNRSHWNSHNQCRSAHRKRFSLVSRSPTNTFLHSLLFRLVRTASIYSLHILLPYAQLLCLESQHFTTARTLSTVCGQYFCLFALYVDRGYTPKQFVDLVHSAKADSQISRMFEQEFGTLCSVPRGKEQSCCCVY
jgi:hypothetical protein